MCACTCKCIWECLCMHVWGGIIGVQFNFVMYRSKMKRLDCKMWNILHIILLYMNKAMKSIMWVAIPNTFLLLPLLSWKTFENSNPFSPQRSPIVIMKIKPQYIMMTIIVCWKHIGKFGFFSWGSGRVLTDHTLKMKCYNFNFIQRHPTRSPITLQSSFFYSCSKQWIKWS